jgi:hypothetical protein
VHTAAAAVTAAVVIGSTLTTVLPCPAPAGILYCSMQRMLLPPHAAAVATTDTESAAAAV